MSSIMIAVASALLISILTAFFTPVRKYLFGPTLRVIAFKGERTEEGFHWQVFVTSTGVFSSDRAIGCRAKISVWRVTENEVFADETKLRPINFSGKPSIQWESICWARAGYPEKMDINPSDVEPIELAFFNLNDRKIIIPSEKGWTKEGGLDLVHLKPHNYTFHIIVTAENAHPGWADFEFRKPIEEDKQDGPWLTFCLERNRLSLFRIPHLLPGVFDLRDAGIKR